MSVSGNDPGGALQPVPAGVESLPPRPHPEGSGTRTAAHLVSAGGDLFLREHHMIAASSIRRIAATVLAAGAVVGAVAVPASADGGRHHQRPQVEISRVQADSPGRDDRSIRSVNGEWVEITNTTRHAVNLKGWTLRDEDGNRYRFKDVRLGGRDTIRIHTGHGRDTRTDLFQDRNDHVWDNRSDTATLRNDRGRVVDTESWGRRHR
ncbi:lamin tail domain-containing protein [Streptomyces sp. NPDC002054]|uniref:lamin tail domain-containing protein n=1 Tax=Streptomyces sp. NPDC002054 TaxID=3154663 RepID=UPI00332FD2A5